MSKQTVNSLFMLPPSGIQDAFYQHLLVGVATYNGLAHRIINKIEVAHAFRQLDQVRELSRLLINIPIKEYQLIAQYYLVWCKGRELKYPAEVLENIIEQTETYKTKALFSRGALEWYQGDNETAFYFYREALKTSPTISERIDLSRTIAVLKSQEGFHKSALRDLENLLPVIKHAEPLVYYDFLNSYAVELIEADRLNEAHSISLSAVSSPFGPYYSEWQETFSEVNQDLYRGRSSVTVSMPEKQPEVTKPQPQAKIIAFPKKEVPADDILDTLNQLDITSLNPLQLLGLILKVVLKDRITYAEVERICSSYYRVILECYVE